MYCKPDMFSRHVVYREDYSEPDGIAWSRARKLRVYGRGTSDKVAGQPGSGENRRVVGGWSGATYRDRQNSWPRCPALSANAVVVGAAGRLGRRRHVNRILSPIRRSCPRITE